jgi:hypothetical protein
MIKRFLEAELSLRSLDYPEQQETVLKWTVNGMYGTMYSCRVGFFFNLSVNPD